MKFVYNTLMKPGETIAPGSSEPSREPVTQAAPAPEEQPVSSTPLPAAPEEAPPEPASPWQNSTDQTATAAPGAGQTPAQSVSWTASEYVTHHKGASWYMGLLGGIVVVVGLVYVVTHEALPSLAIGLGGLLFGVFAARKPQVLQYSVDSHGLAIGTKRYPYQLFRSFSVMDEGVIRSILLMPTQRFNLPITVYYDPKDEEAIITVLGAFLPHEERTVSPIDRFMSQIRF